MENCQCERQKGDLTPQLLLINKFSTGIKKVNTVFRKLEFQLNGLLILVARGV